MQKGANLSLKLAIKKKQILTSRDAIFVFLLLTLN